MPTVNDARSAEAAINARTTSTATTAINVKTALATILGMTTNAHRGAGWHAQSAETGAANAADAEVRDLITTSALS
jgi:hypothetical protein